MLHLNDLPDLIVYHILKYIQCPYNEEEDFKQRLMFLAINRKLRQIGLPSVYNCLSLDADLCHATKDPKQRQIPIGNYRLYQTSELRHLVRSIKFGRQDTSANLEDFQVLVQEFMEGLIGSEATADIMLREYIKLFPNVSKVSIWANEPGGTGNVFVNEWVNVFGCQLTTLHIHMPLPKPISELPPNLTQLTFDCGLDGQIELPFVDPTSLHYLHLIDPPSNFLWKCFQPKGNLLVFPNLETLKVSCEEYYMENGRKDINTVDITPDHLQLQLPNLRVLDIHIFRLKNFIFRPTMFPTHLYRLNADQVDIAMQIFDTLPLVSVDYLNLDIRQFISDPNEEFYTATNYLFGQITATKEVSLRLDTELFLDLDLDRIKWVNLTRLELAGPNPGICVQYLDSFPRLTKLLIACLKSNRTELDEYYQSTVYNDLDDLKDHGLVDLIVTDKWDLWSFNEVAKLALALVGNIKNLKKVALEYIHRRMFIKLVGEAGEKYPHLGKVKVEKLQYEDNVWKRLD